MNTSDIDKLNDDSIRNANSALDFARRLAEGYNGWNGDRQDAFTNNYLQALMREEDFQRSTPQEQVKRLMAAGMSRAGALAALQEQQYGNAQTGIAGNVEQTTIDRINAITNGVQTLMQVVQSGFEIGASVASINAILESTRAHRLQNIQTTDYVQALQYVGKYMQAFDNYAVNNENELPPSLGAAIDAVGNSEFREQISDWNDAMRNPYFYAAMRKAYADRAMDKQELYNKMRRDTADANLADYGVEKACAELDSYILNNNFFNDIYNDKVDMVHQELLGKESEVVIAGQDAQYWVENNGKARREYLSALTQQEKNAVRLGQLQIDMQEYDAFQAQEMLNALKQAQAMGKDYFDVEVDNMLKQRTNLNNVLCIANAASSRAVNRENVSNAMANSGFHLTAGALRVYNWLQAHGVIEKAISVAESAGLKAIVK